MVVKWSNRWKWPWEPSADSIGTVNEEDVARLSPARYEQVDTYGK